MYEFISTVSNESLFLILTLSYFGGLNSFNFSSKTLSIDLNLDIIGRVGSADVNDKNFGNILSSNHPHLTQTLFMFIL